MNQFATLFIFTLAISHVLGASTPPPEENGPSKFNQLLAQIKDILPDPNQVIETINKQLELQVNNLQTISTKINEQVDKTNLDKYFQQISDKLGELKASLEESVGSNVTAKAAEIKNQIQSNLQTANAEFNKILTSAKPNLEKAGESMQNIAKEAWEGYLKATQNLKTKINNYLQQAEATPTK